MIMTLDSHSSAPPSAPPARERMSTSQRVTLLVICTATAMLMLDIAVVNTALPAMAREFGADLTSLKWVIDGYTLALATVVLSAGAWGDRSGRRRVFAIGVVGFTVASAMCSLASSMLVLNLARAVQGLAAALLFATGLAILAHAFPGRGERTRALAAFGASIGAAFAVGPLLGGVLTQWFDWRAIFIVNVPLGAVMICLLGWIAESRSGAPRRGDLGGQLAAMVALGSLTYGLFEAHSLGWTDPRTLALFAVAILAAGIFVIVESIVAQPMLPLAMFANPGFAGAQVATFAISASLFSVFVYLTIYLQGVVGMSPVDAGLVYLPGTLLMLVAAGIVDRLLTRVPAWSLLSIGLVAIAAGLAWTTIAEVDGNGWNLIGGFALACVGAGIFNPVMSGVVLAESRDDDAGLASGINDVFRQSGIAVGVALLGALFPARSILAGGSPQEFVDGLHLALWVSCGIAAAGAAIVVFTMRRARATTDA